MTPKEFRDTRHAPKGSSKEYPRGGLRKRLRRGSSGGRCEGVFRRALRRGLPEGLSSGAALVVRLKIYGPSGPASSDWPNGQAVTGRPIGDQRSRWTGFLLLQRDRGQGGASVAVLRWLVGGATSRFDSVGAGQNGTRRRGGISGRGRLRPAGTGGGRRRGTAAGLTGAKGVGAPV